MLAGQEPGWRSALLPGTKAALEVRGLGAAPIAPATHAWSCTLGL